MTPAPMALGTERMMLNHQLLQFAYLQILDLMTTVAFLLHGVQEGNPIVRFMMEHSSHPLNGLIAVKVLAIILGIYCWRMRRVRVMSRINIVFAIVVAWNLAALIVGPRRF